MLILLSFFLRASRWSSVSIAQGDRPVAGTFSILSLEEEDLVRLVRRSASGLSVIVEQPRLSSLGRRQSLDDFMDLVVDLVGK